MDHGHGREHENFSPSIAYATPKRSAPTTHSHLSSVLSSHKDPTCHTTAVTSQHTPFALGPSRLGPRASSLHKNHKPTKSATSHLFSASYATSIKTQCRIAPSDATSTHRTLYTVAKSSLSNRSRNASPHIALIARSAWRVAPPPLCAAPPRAWPPSSP